MCSISNESPPQLAQQTKQRSPVPGGNDNGENADDADEARDPVSGGISVERTKTTTTTGGKDQRGDSDRTRCGLLTVCRLRGVRPAKKKASPAKLRVDATFHRRLPGELGEDVCHNGTVSVAPASTTS